MNEKKIIKYEFIGSEIKIIDSKNKSLIGINGKIADETKNMFMLDNGKKIIKSECKFKMKIKGKTVEINGKVLVARPEDRVKKLLR
ncbi:ribonuclease P protein subunit [Candidatus Woesearchaeota archaeon]|nr:ribonuclease P protein subunit [Candidatus Woesearchaeota archaeon]